MTTTTLDFDGQLQEKINGTLGYSIQWKAVARADDGRTYFVTFGTLEGYTQWNVRQIAVRLFERHPAHPVLYRIRRADLPRARWIHASEFISKKDKAVILGGS